MNRISKKKSVMVFKILLCAVFLQTTFFAMPLVYAAETTQKGYTLLAEIPTVDTTKGTPDLPSYLKGLVVLAVGLAIVFAVFMIVYGGVKYTVAITPSGKGDAKKYLSGAIFGLLIALFSYLLLQTINPALLNVGLNLSHVYFDTVVNIEGTREEYTQTGDIIHDGSELCVITVSSENSCSQTCTPATGDTPAAECATNAGAYKARGIKECSTESTSECISKPCGSNTVTKPSICASTSGNGNGQCEAVHSTPCSVENLKKYFGEANAENASMVCYYESGGGDPRAKSGYDVCKDGRVFSWGLFQVNLTQNDLNGLHCAYNTHKNDSPFTAPNSDCTVRNETLWNQCVDAAIDPDVNIQHAAILFKAKGWQPWTNTAIHCGLPY
ncbi:hypothetical protein D4R99_01345 [bacterium]|nr:MAG: hypothetical protein D4R99_01345 [bacterium]